MNYIIKRRAFMLRPSRREISLSTEYCGRWSSLCMPTGIQNYVHTKGILSAASAFFNIGLASQVKPLSSLSNQVASWL